MFCTMLYQLERFKTSNDASVDLDLNRLGQTALRLRGDVVVEEVAVQRRLDDSANHDNRVPVAANTTKQP